MPDLHWCVHFAIRDHLPTNIGLKSRYLHPTVAKIRNEQKLMQRQASASIVFQGEVEQWRRGAKLQRKQLLRVAFVIDRLRGQDAQVAHRARMNTLAGGQIEKPEQQLPYAANGILAAQCFKLLLRAQCTRQDLDETE